MPLSKEDFYMNYRPPILNFNNSWLCILAQ